MIIKIIKLIKDFIKRLNVDNVNALSAQAAFFLILSFFPFIMLLIPLIKYIPFDVSIVEILSEVVLPSKIQSVIKSFTEEMTTRPTVKFLSLTAVSTLWMASGGIFALMKGFNQINRIKETRNYIMLKMYALFYTVVFIGIIIIMFLVYLFGNTIYNYIIVRIAPGLRNFAEFIIGMRTVGGIIMLTILFLPFYKVLPNCKTSFLAALPGSVFTAAAWVIFSYIYSFYINNISNYSYIYGSITAIVFLMLWLYICMYIMFIGEEINIFLKEKRYKEYF